MDCNPRTLLLSRALALVLCCVLIAPQIIPPSEAAGIDHHVAAPVNLPHGVDHHHPNETESDIASHCHPGIDCHFQAIVVIFPMSLPLAGLERFDFHPHGPYATGISHDFDPPPPRVLS